MSKVIFTAASSIAMADVRRARDVLEKQLRRPDNFDGTVVFTQGKHDERREYIRVGNVLRPKRVTYEIPCGKTCSCGKTYNAVPRDVDYNLEYNGFFMTCDACKSTFLAPLGETKKVLS